MSRFIPNNFNHGGIFYFPPKLIHSYNVEIAWARDNRFRTVLFNCLLAIVRMQLFFLSPDGDDVMLFVCIA